MSELTRKHVLTGAGLGLGGFLVAPTAAQADDFQVTNLNDSGAGSLREAISDSNTNAGADRILFASTLSGTIGLTSGQLSIGDPVQVLGPGPRRLTVSGNGDSRIFSLALIPGDVSISGLTLTRGDTSGNGGAIIAHEPFALSNSVISGSHADGVGGGLYLQEGIFSIENTTISGNSAAAGGGIWHKYSDVNLENTTVSGNSSGTYGGAVHTRYATFSASNSTIAGNNGGDGFDGGGVSAFGATIRLEGSIVADNIPGDLLDAGDDPLFEGAFNLIEDPGNATFPTPNNLLGLDPKLKPLKNNGGPTDTQALKKKSAAKNTGPSSAPRSDQRGAPRKGRPDIGAYELTKCKGVIVNRVGTAGKDKLKGTKKKDGILGLGGNDKLSGRKGKDGLCGGRGKDKLKGGPGKDKLDGGPGKDKEVQ